MRFINGVRHLRQEEDYTCVAACVRIVLDYWGVQQSEQDIATLTHTTIAGTRLEEATAIAEFGVEVVVERATLVGLRRYLDSHPASCG